MARIGLVVDNPRRDLQGIALVADELSRRGHEVFIIPLYHQGFDVPLLRLDAVLVNYARPANKEFLKMCRKFGTKVIVLDTEGGVLSESGVDSPDNWARFIREMGLGELIDGYCFWGPRVHEAFVKGSGIAPEKLRVTGCPRYDVCHESLQGLLEYPIDDFVLINTNYSAINPKFTRSKADELKAFKEAGWDPQYTERFVHDLEEVWAKFIEAMKEIFRRIPEQKFLLRPHPFERADVYREAFQGFPNVVVDGLGTVMNVIAHCRVVLHLNCGSAVETNMLRRVPVGLEFLNNDIQKAHTPLPWRISHGVETLDELEWAIRHPKELADRYPFDSHYENFIAPYFGPRDGRASSRVADVIESTMSSKRAPIRRDILASIEGCTGGTNWKRVVQGIGSQFIGSKRVEDWRVRANPTRGDKRLDIKQVELLMRSLNAGGSAVQGKSPVAVHAEHPLTRSKLETLQVEKRS